MIAAIKAADRTVASSPPAASARSPSLRLPEARRCDALGPVWASPTTFRFGASGLYDALVAAIEGRPDGGDVKGLY